MGADGDSRWRVAGVEHESSCGRGVSNLSIDAGSPPHHAMSLDSWYQPLDRRAGGRVRGGGLADVHMGKSIVGAGVKILLGIQQYPRRGKPVRLWI
jgi:hypothetical protein